MRAAPKFGALCMAFGLDSLVFRIASGGKTAAAVILEIGVTTAKA
ncbi:hypothetical protein HMPREF3198_02096 [Winkia neuii]|nr:hypothetical protein HMPREF3198_02096 [Winkia neuii]